MADLDEIRADFPNIADDDALLLIDFPREGEDRPYRAMRCYQLAKADIWGGVGEDKPMPDYVRPADDPKPEEKPSEIVSEWVVVCDWLNVRDQPSVSGLALRQVKKGAVLTLVTATTTTPDKIVWHKVAGVDQHVAEKSAKGEILLRPKV